MPLQSMALLTGCTISASGGTAQNFAADGTVVDRGIVVRDSAETDVRTQDFVQFRNMPGVLQRDGTWSKTKRVAKFVSPDLLSTGVQDMPFFEITFHGSPLHTPAKILAMKEKACQLLFDADVSLFWANGSLT